MNNASVISIILPVLNEVARINQAISRLRGLRPGPAIEIIVVDGDPRGGTVKAIRDRQVKTTISEEGRARQMNRGASLASGNILLFLHVDTFLPADALVRVKKAMADGRQVAGAFDLGIRTERRIFRITEKYAALRTRLTRVPFGDQAIFIRKDYFNRLGGCIDLPPFWVIAILWRISKNGGAIFFIS